MILYSAIKLYTGQLGSNQEYNTSYEQVDTKMDFVQKARDDGPAAGTKNALSFF